MFDVLIYIVLIFFLNLFLKKKKYLQSHNGSDHQRLTNISIPLTGGIFLILPVILIFKNQILLFLITFFCLFVIGLLSDSNILTSAKKRFFLQLILIFLFVFITKLEVFPTRIDFIDENFKNTYVSYFFTIFCLMILVNGSNFIDGLNGLLLGYFCLILVVLYKLNLIMSLGLSEENTQYFLILFLFILFLNFTNQLFLGDNGAYSLSFLIGYILINIYNSNNFVTPYFIILLLWYPCFENLFSIIRKLITNNSPLEPDNKHLHQYLFIYIKRKFKLKDIYSNIFSSLLINLYNLIIFFWASKNLNQTYIQINLLILNILVYFTFYILLQRLIFKKKFNH